MCYESFKCCIIGRLGNLHAMTCVRRGCIQALSHSPLGYEKSASAKFISDAKSSFSHSVFPDK